MADSTINVRIAASGGTVAATEIEKVRASMGTISLEGPKAERALSGLVFGLERMASTGEIGGRSLRTVEMSLMRLVPGMGMGLVGIAGLAGGVTLLTHEFEKLQKANEEYWKPLVDITTAHEDARLRVARLADEYARLQAFIEKGRASSVPLWLQELGAIFGMAYTGQAGSMAGLAAAQMGMPSIGGPLTISRTPMPMGYGEDIGPQAPTDRAARAGRTPRAYWGDNDQGWFEQMYRRGDPHAMQWGTLSKGFDDSGGPSLSGMSAGVMNDAMRSMEPMNKAILEQTSHIRDLNKGYQDVAKYSAEAFGTALDALTRSGGGIAAMTKAILEGLRRQFVAKAAGELAEGVADLFNPFMAPFAAGHFKAAALFTAAAGLAGGMENGLGGGGGMSGASYASNTSGALSGSTATIYIEGGILDMSDPRQRDALAQAIQQLSGLRTITLVTA